MQNLWEDSSSFEDGHHAAGRRAGRRTGNRASTEAATLAALRAWLLHDYIVPYCRSLAAARIFRRCFWIDGLGETRNIQPNFQDAAAAAQQLATESRPMALQLLALQPSKGKSAAVATSQVDDKKKKGAKQAERTGETQGMPFVLPKQSGIINMDWLTAAPFLLESLDQAAALFLLNPLAAATSQSTGSTKQERLPFFTHNDLAPLYTRTAPTELCLLLSHAQVESRLLPALRSPAGAAAFTALLRSDRWKAALTSVVGTRFIASASTPASRPQAPGRGEAQPPGRDEARPYDVVADLLQGAIRPHFMAVQRFAFPVCVGPAIIEEAPYTLLFATRRQDSLVCMNDALCEYRRRLEEQSYQGLLNEDWFRERQRARLAGEMHALAEDIRRLGRTQAPRRWPDLRQQLLLDRFGGALLRDYDECISRLLEAGEVRCEWRQRGQQTLAAGQVERRIPGNEDILYWGKRL